MAFRGVHDQDHLCLTPLIGGQMKTSRLALPASLGRKELVEMWRTSCRCPPTGGHEDDCVCHDLLDRRELISRHMIHFNSCGIMYVVGRHSELVKLESNVLTVSLPKDRNDALVLKYRVKVVMRQARNNDTWKPLKRKRAEPGTSRPFKSKLPIAKQPLESPDQVSCPSLSQPRHTMKRRKLFENHFCNAVGSEATKEESGNSSDARERMIVQQQNDKLAFKSVRASRNHNLHNETNTSKPKNSNFAELESCVLGNSGDNVQVHQGGDGDHCVDTSLLKSQLIADDEESEGFLKTKHTMAVQQESDKLIFARKLREDEQEKQASKTRSVYPALVSRIGRGSVTTEPNDGSDDCEHGGNTTEVELNSQEFESFLATQEEQTDESSESTDGRSERVDTLTQCSSRSPVDLSITSQPTTSSHHSDGSSVVESPQLTPAVGVAHVSTHRTTDSSVESPSQPSQVSHDSSQEEKSQFVASVPQHSDGTPPKPNDLMGADEHSVSLFQCTAADTESRDSDRSNSKNQSTLVTSQYEQPIPESQYQQPHEKSSSFLSLPNTNRDESASTLHSSASRQIDGANNEAVQEEIQRQHTYRRCRAWSLRDWRKEASRRESTSPTVRSVLVNLVLDKNSHRSDDARDLWLPSILNKATVSEADVFRFR